MQRSILINQIVPMVQRALDLVDPRLVHHGANVALLVDGMLEVLGGFDEQDRHEAYMLSLFHDIGAYRTEEIEHMVEFETGAVWEHSIYGYLFLRDLSPLSHLAEMVLYHHMPYEKFTIRDDKTALLAQVLQVADRVDVCRVESETAPVDLKSRLEENRGTQFMPKAIDAFYEAERRFSLMDSIRQGEASRFPKSALELPFHEGVSYLSMIVHTIDFRSPQTMAHTMATAQAAYSLGIRRGLSDRDLARIYSGALIHDFGKIGIPVEILEKPGRLTDDEMVIMRTHVDLTERVISGCVDETTAAIALRHHEKLDGSGYPRALHATELTESERIMAVADIVSALSRKRSYKAALGKDQALAILQDMASDGLVDADIVVTLGADYDAIMHEIEQVCTPVMETYARIDVEYRELLEKFTGRSS